MAQVGKKYYALIKHKLENYVQIKKKPNPYWKFVFSKESQPGPLYRSVNTLYLVEYQKTGKSILWALDFFSGKPAWHKVFPQTLSKKIYLRDGHLFIWDKENLYALDRLTGEVKWAKAISIIASPINSSTPLLFLTKNKLFTLFGTAKSSLGEEKRFSWKRKRGKLQYLSKERLMRFSYAAKESYLKEFEKIHRYPRGFVSKGLVLSQGSCMYRKNDLLHYCLGSKTKTFDPKGKLIGYRFKTVRQVLVSKDQNLFLISISANYFTKYTGEMVIKKTKIGKYKLADSRDCLVFRNKEGLKVTDSSGKIVSYLGPGEYLPLEKTDLDTAFIWKKTEGKILKVICRKGRKEPGYKAPVAL